jgi:hypothetical protein
MSNPTRCFAGIEPTRLEAQEHSGSQDVGAVRQHVRWQGQGRVMARQTEKFGFMMRYSVRRHSRDAIRNNHPDLQSAKAHVIEKAMQKMSRRRTQRITQINHPSRGVKMHGTSYQLNDRGENVLMSDYGKKFVARYAADPTEHLKHRNVHVSDCPRGLGQCEHHQGSPEGGHRFVRRERFCIHGEARSLCCA